MRIIVTVLYSINDVRIAYGFIFVSFYIIHIQNVIRVQCALCKLQFSYFPPFRIISLLINRYDGNSSVIHTYYADITLNWFTGIISISLSSNYTFRSDDVAQLHTCCYVIRDTHINYPLWYRQCA